MSITNSIRGWMCPSKMLHWSSNPNYTGFDIFLELRSFQSQSNTNEIIRVSRYDWYIVKRVNLNTGMVGNLCEEILGEVFTRLKVETEVIHPASQGLAELPCKPPEAESEPGEQIHPGLWMNQGGTITSDHSLQSKETIQSLAVVCGSNFGHCDGWWGNLEKSFNTD